MYNLVIYRDWFYKTFVFLYTYQLIVIQYSILCNEQHIYIYNKLSIAIICMSLCIVKHMHSNEKSHCMFS